MSLRIYRNIIEFFERSKTGTAWCDLMSESFKQINMSTDFNFNIHILCDAIKNKKKNKDNIKIIKEFIIHSEKVKNSWWEIMCWKFYEEFEIHYECVELKSEYIITLLS